jgi:hypothetical protein
MVQRITRMVITTMSSTRVNQEYFFVIPNLFRPLKNGLCSDLPIFLNEVEDFPGRQSFRTETSSEYPPTGSPLEGLLLLISCEVFIMRENKLI